MRREGETMNHKYKPFVFSLTCRENRESYAGMFRGLQKAMLEFLNVLFDFDICVIDHNQSAVNAILDFTPIKG